MHPDEPDHSSSARAHSNTLFDFSEPLELCDVETYDCNSATELNPPTWNIQPTASLTQGLEATSITARNVSVDSKDDVAANVHPTAFHEVRDESIGKGDGEITRRQQPAAKVDKQNIAASLAMYFQKYQSSNEAWLHAPEIPDASEIIGPMDSELGEGDPALRRIELDQPWPSAHEYLKQQYMLMREDAVSTLREAVHDQKQHFNQTEDESYMKARLYERVYISGLKVTPIGIAHRLDFSLGRVGKRVSWASSRRLKVGTIVALTPVADHFRETCIVAVVAGRALADLEAEIPSIEVYFGDPDTIEIDPQVEYLMVESSRGYFEACRHTLKALQHMTTERFPLAEHLVHLHKDISAPEHLTRNPRLNIGIALESNNAPLEVDVLAEWPDVKHSHSVASLLDSPEETGETVVPVTHLDESQFEALRRILTKRLAIVQGPPGTGKTYVSVVALRIILQNREIGDPPIIITAQTNHALDQLLRHISPFCPDFIRLGGQSKDLEIIQPRTLHRVKAESTQTYIDLKRQLAAIRRGTKILVKEMEDLLVPLTSDKPCDPKVFLNYHLISYDQYRSLLDTNESWVGEAVDDDSHAIMTWGEDKIQPFLRSPLRHSNIHALEPENEDDEDQLEGYFESFPQDVSRDVLHGDPFYFPNGYASTVTVSDLEGHVKNLLQSTRNLYDLPLRSRAILFTWLSMKVKLSIRDRIRSLAKALKKREEDLKIVKMQIDAAYLREAPIIGVTTTGLSKYRAVLNSLAPQIVLIEEAAETQESYVAAACFESLDQLILVGDHQQLQAHCQNDIMMDYNLHISMFERLVEHNDIEFQQLNMQRRMLPEMRKTMNVIYPKLIDHPSVHGRLDIPGMGGRNTWWMMHKTADSIDEHFSWVNREEAEMVAHFFQYLVANGVPTQCITVLTFYNGQRRAIISAIKRLSMFDVPPSLSVHTVDSYQGEENEVVILSLVRSNFQGKIGFLSVANRVCVAMSRARRGFYIFGNAQQLFQQNLMWAHMINRYHSDSDRSSSRLGKHLPLVCQRHGNKLKIKNSMEWANNCGGCDLLCAEVLPCGHVCRSLCHPQPHEDLGCGEDCGEILPCGHQCEKICGQVPCECRECREAPLARKAAPRAAPQVSRGWETAPRAKPSPKQRRPKSPSLIDFSDHGDEPLVKVYKPEEQVKMPAKAITLVGAPSHEKLDNLSSPGDRGNIPHALASPQSPVSQARAVQAYQQFAQANIREGRRSSETARKLEPLADLNPNSGLFRKPGQLVPRAEAEKASHRHPTPPTRSLESVPYHKGNRLVRTELLSYGNPSLQARGLEKGFNAGQSPTAGKAEHAEKPVAEEEDLIDLSGF